MTFKTYPPSASSPPAPATDAEIRACEERHGVCLPPCLIALLKIQNGGALDAEDSSEPLCTDLLGVSIDSNPSSLPWEPQIASLHDWLLARGDLETPYDTYPALDHLGDIRKLISIAGIGTYHYLLDYRTQSESPEVYFLDLVGGDQKLRFVADTLEKLFS
jgi:hypothetical protein